MARITVLKLGGELLEEPGRVAAIAQVIKQTAAKGPLVVVHGGGREIDRALFAAGIAKQQIDGLRITDEATLQVVVSVLGGTVNTQFVAALNATKVKAVGLTGADASVAPVRKAAPHTTVSGATVSLGHVGEPAGRVTPALLLHLTKGGYVPVIASVSASTSGELFNVNADSLAADVAARLGASRLVIAGATPGVLDAAGATLPIVDRALARRMVASGEASAGMVAKLRACQKAARAGVRDVRITDGRVPAGLTAALAGAPEPGPWTRVK
jgi:acetylglutamate kinase